jgi:hypothetical protein
MIVTGIILLIIHLPPFAMSEIKNAEIDPKIKAIVLAPILNLIGIWGNRRELKR